jgi:hypothetical protein
MPTHQYNECLSTDYDLRQPFYSGPELFYIDRIIIISGIVIFFQKNSFMVLFGCQKPILKNVHNIIYKLH